MRTFESASRPPGPYYAFEWVRPEEYNGRRRALIWWRVAHSRLYVFTEFHGRNPNSVPLLVFHFELR